MSLKFEIDCIPVETREQITNELSFVFKNDYGGFVNQVEPINVVNEDVYIPFYYALKNVGDTRPSRENLSLANIQFIPKLRNIQKAVKTDIISTLNRKKVCMISLYPGAGKTFLSIYIASTLGLKTLVISHRKPIINQWKKSVEMATSSKVQILNSKSVINDDADFYVASPTTVTKLGADAFFGIGFLIVDELHCVVVGKLLECLLCITPRYLLGLSATPYRHDMMNDVINVFFGETRIGKNLHHFHKVMMIRTNFSPHREYTEQGVKWMELLKSQGNCVERNEMIIHDIILKHHDRRFIVMTKLKSQANYIHKRLTEMKESSTKYTGDDENYDTNARILIITVSKGGTGFDDPSRDAIIFAADLYDYFIQYLGRIFRNEDSVPLVFDIVDKDHSLKKHWLYRESVYRECGGEIQKCVKNII